MRFAVLIEKDATATATQFPTCREMCRGGKGGITEEDQGPEIEGPRVHLEGMRFMAKTPGRRRFCGVTSRFAMRAYTTWRKLVRKIRWPAFDFVGPSTRPRRDGSE